MRRTFPIALFCALALGLGATGPAASEEPLEVVIIAHPKTPASKLSRTDLEDIFSTSRRFWSNGQRARPFNLPPKHQVRVAFDRAVLQRSPVEVGRFWIDRRVRGGNPPPKHIPNTKVMLKVIARLPGSIGYVPARLVDDSVQVVGRIRGGRLVAEQR